MSVEAEYAACLLAVGGPERLKDGVTTAEYLFVCAGWYDKVIERGEPLKHILRRPPSPIDRISNASRNEQFTLWWVSYKAWLSENWRG